LVEKCSYCGEEGHSIQNCPKWKGVHHSDKEAWREAIVTEFEMDKLFRFQHDIDYDEWEKLYTQIGEERGLGTLYLRGMASHLWEKFHAYDHQIVKLWPELDYEQRSNILAMIARWKGL